MFPLTMITAVALILLFALIWHDKPAREPVLARRITSHRFWKTTNARVATKHQMKNQAQKR